MAVEIEFKPDARAASEASASDPEAWFHHTVLFVPVRFRVDGRDLLRGSGPRDVWAVDSRSVARPSTPGEDDWNSQPLVGFLLGLEGAVREASRVGAARCSLAAGNADLTFRLRDDGMLEV